MKKHLTTIIYVIFLLIGAILLLYPSVSNYYNSFHQSKAIATYVENLENIDEAEQQEMWDAANEYNISLINKASRWLPTPEETEYYNSLLDISDTGVLGYIEIPKIKVSLPIYHGCSDDVLQVAVGHVEGSSLPIGGASTHSVLSGHRGLPSAKLFTDLDELEEGDTFFIRVFNETLTYEIDQILIVKPDEIDALAIEKDKDYCTLITCTPYGVNSHRMLVRGHRIETKSTSVLKIVSEATQIDPLVIAPMIGIPICFVVIVILLFKPKRK